MPTSLLPPHPKHTHMREKDNREREREKERVAYFEELLVEHYSTDLFHCFLLMTSVKQFSKFVVIASVNFPVHGESECLREGVGGSGRLEIEKGGEGSRGRGGEGRDNFME